MVLGAVLVPLGASRMTSCASQWNACVIKVRQTFIPDPEGYCQPILYQCHFAQWWNAFIWGIVLFITAGGVLCYFCCCAVPPGYTHVSATAYTVTGTYQVEQHVLHKCSVWQQPQQRNTSHNNCCGKGQQLEQK